MRTTEEYKAMSISKRGCLYPEEKDLKWFPVYSEANCFLECAWKRARDTCDCVPWHIIDRFPGSPMCELFGNRCFSAILAERSQILRSECSDCLPDCEITKIKIEPTKFQEGGLISLKEYLGKPYLKVVTLFKLKSPDLSKSTFLAHCHRQH